MEVTVGLLQLVAVCPIIIVKLLKKNGANSCLRALVDDLMLMMQFKLNYDE